MTFDKGDDDRKVADEQIELIEKNQVETTNVRKKRWLPSWLEKPFYVWRHQFQQDKCCPKEMVKTELMSASTYFIFLNTALAGIILFGCQVLDLRHTSTNEEASFLDRALFCITTISTIGYGNIVPFDDKGKLICILYCAAGIPMFFMTVATNSVLVVDMCNILYRSYNEKAQSKTGFRWYISAIVLALHCLIGMLIFSLWIDELSYLDAFYFSFISITTIGYGDYSPTPEGPFQYFVVIVYLCIGVAAMLMFFSSLQNGIMWIHYYGRKVSDSKEREIWYGGQMMTVKDLVIMIAERAGSTPDKLRDVLHDLDKILEVACQQAEDDADIEEQSMILPSHQTTLTSPPAIRKKTVFLSAGSSDGDDNQLTIHSFTSTNQRSIPRDTELAIVALGAIQHHLRKPSVRAKPSQHPRLPPSFQRSVSHTMQRQLSKPSSDTAMDTSEPCTSLELRKKAHRVHSEGKLLDEVDRDEQ